MSKHFKRATSTDRDLDNNPQIGGSKGARMAGITADELEELQGETTFEGDLGNDTNAQGGLDKPIRRVGRPSSNSRQSHGAPAVQGKQKNDVAHASKKHMGAGTQGKSDGSGALTDIPKEQIPENMVLSNRDKSRHSEERGLDSKQIQNEQMQDQPANRMTEE
jgi:hypothetical protein